MNSKICRSLNVPGSLSSPFTQRYFGFVDLLRHERPFEPGRETRPAASAQVRLLHLVGDLVGFHAEGLAQHRIAAVRLVDVDAVDIREWEEAGEVPWSLQLVQDLVHLGGVEVFVVFVADLHHGRRAARAEALRFDQREPFWSGVVSPTLMCSRSSICFRMRSLLRSMQETFVQTSILCLPTGFRLNIV